MKIAEILKKMITFSNGNIHDIDHFIRVWTYAATIGRLEGLDPETQLTLEIAAIVHDIACPLCREKYGNTNGENQERESPPLVDAFFADLPVPAQDVARISWLVAHHHTYTNVDGPDYQILLEADFIINAGESGYPRTAIENAKGRVFRTVAGIRLLEEMHLKHADKGA